MCKRYFCFRSLGFVGDYFGYDGPRVSIGWLRFWLMRLLGYKVRAEKYGPARTYEEVCKRVGARVALKDALEDLCEEIHSARWRFGWSLESWEMCLQGGKTPYPLERIRCLAEQAGGWWAEDHVIEAVVFLSTPEWLALVERGGVIWSHESVTDGAAQG